MRYKGIKAKAWEAVRQALKKREKDCYTCERKNLEGANWQAGHYKPVAVVGSNNKLSWLPGFIHAQCSRCNGPGQGMSKEYEAHLRKDGIDVDWFEKNYRKTNPIKNWQEIIDLWITHGQKNK